MWTHCLLYLINNIYIVKYCSSTIIDENKLSSAHSIQIQPNLHKKILHNKRLTQLLFQASSYLCIGHCNITSP